MHQAQADQEQGSENSMSKATQPIHQWSQDLTSKAHASVPLRQ